MAEILTEAALLAWLDNNRISYAYFSHPPVFTCEESARLRTRISGANTKNLFLRDRSKRFYLYITDCDRRADIKVLGKAIGAPKLHFADETAMMQLLGVTPGSVTVLGLINDTDRLVTVLIDAAVWQEENFLCHPLVNTATVTITRSDLQHFFELTGHAYQIVELSSPS